MEAGTPDILACIPIDTRSESGCSIHGGVIGRFVAFETKMPDGGDPTPVQEHRHNQIRAAGGVVIVPRSVQDAVEALEELGMVNPADGSS